MARRIKTIAEWINANMDGYKAEIIEGFCDTDRKAGRLRIPGKGRYGNRLIVRKAGAVVLDHNSAETYRRNEEIEEWLDRELHSGKAQG